MVVFFDRPLILSKELCYIIAMLPRQTPTSDLPPIPPAFEQTLLTLLQTTPKLTEHQLMLHLVEQGFEQSAGLSARYLSPDSKLFHKEFPL